MCADCFLCFSKESKTNFPKQFLRLLTHVEFLRQNDLIFSEVFLYAERSKNHEKKIYHNRAKSFSFLRRFDCENTVFGISRNLIHKLVFK